MNVVQKVGALRGADAVAHSVMAYDRSTEALVSDLPIPLFLDTLALRIAAVPAEDTYGAASYALQPRAVDTFGFLFGLEVDLQAREYFLEASPGDTSVFAPAKREAVAVLSEVSPGPRSMRLRTGRISEGELVMPTLRLLETGNGTWMTTTELIVRLTELFAPLGTDAESLRGSLDADFSQTVRAMISHRDRPASFINRGLAEYSATRQGLRLSDLGRLTVRALRS